MLRVLGRIRVVARAAGGHNITICGLGDPCTARLPIESTPLTGCVACGCEDWCADGVPEWSGEGRRAGCRIGSRAGRTGGSAPAADTRCPAGKSAAKSWESMSVPNVRPVSRVPSQHFSGGAFGFTAAALVLAPFMAAGNVFHSYIPFLLLRLWTLGFCWYGMTLARRAGGVRRVWQAVYGLVALPFLFVWGLNVEGWAVIDWASAALIGVSAIFLRTEPSGSSGQ